MVDKRILRLTPKRILCPLCGEWHEWEGEKLQSYDKDEPYEYECNDVTVSIWVDDDVVHIYAESPCDMFNDEIVIDANLRDMEYDGTNPVIKIPFSLKADEIIDEIECKDCECCDYCNFVEIGENRKMDEDEYIFKLEFKIEFASRYFNKYSEASPKKNVQTTNQVKEDTIMTNNIFNMNMEFGQSKDENIASTLMGVAVKNGDSWRIYDKKKKEITDVGAMELGNFPIFILPTTKLNEGDLIKDNGEYYFVMEVANGSTQTLCAKTGEMKTVIPIKNILGFSCYSKVISLSDSINMGDGIDVEELAIMSAMFGQCGKDGGQMNQLLPMICFKDKLGVDGDMMKMMLMTSMMSAPVEGNDQNATMNPLFMFMLLREMDGGDDDMKKLVIMSSMMGGNIAGNNPAVNYMLFDGFMGKKKEKKVQELNPESTGTEPTDPDNSEPESSEK